MAIREDLAFIEAVRPSSTKAEGADREGADPQAELDMASSRLSQSTSPAAASSISTPRRG